MPTDTLERFREETRKLGNGETKKRQGELLEKIRADALALIALASEISIVSEKKNRLEQLLDAIRAAVEEMKATTEAQIAAVLALAEEATRIWEAMWAEALGDPATDRAKVTTVLRWVLEAAEQTLREALRRSQELADRFERPPARLDELASRVAEFPLWARECLARWEMLDCPAPPLDSERVARAQAACSRGECEDVEEVLSRVEAGGPWVKEARAPPPHRPGDEPEAGGLWPVARRSDTPPRSAACRS